MFISKKEYEAYQDLHKTYQDCVTQLLKMEVELGETRQKYLDLAVKYQDLKRKIEPMQTYSVTIETDTKEIFIYKGIKAFNLEEAKHKAYQKLDLSSYKTYWVSIKLED